MNRELLKRVIENVKDDRLCADVIDFMMAKAKKNKSLEIDAAPAPAPAATSHPSNAGKGKILTSQELENFFIKYGVLTCGKISGLTLGATFGAAIKDLRMRNVIERTGGTRGMAAEYTYRGKKVW